MGPSIAGAGVCVAYSQAYSSRRTFRDTHRMADVLSGILSGALIASGGVCSPGLSRLRLQQRAEVVLRELMHKIRKLTRMVRPRTSSGGFRLPLSCRLRGSSRLGGSGQLRAMQAMGHLRSYGIAPKVEECLVGRPFMSANLRSCARTGKPAGLA